MSVTTSRQHRASADGVNVLPAEGSGRLAVLDALRGVAAFLVLLSHCHAMLPAAITDAWRLEAGPARLLVLGRPAVMFFLVLSGFVLALSLDRDPLPYGRFVVRRVFRIYLPFAVSILVSAALFLAIDPKPQPALSAWFNRDVWTGPATLEVLLGHLFMTGRHGDATLNNPMWSLTIEMRVSLLFPLLMAVLWKRPPRSLILAALLGLVLTEVLGRTTSLGREPYYNESWRQAVLLTLYFTSFFVVGIALARWRGKTLALAKAAGPVWRAAGWLAALTLLSLQRDVPNAAGAALILILTPASPSVMRVLGTAPLQWLGRVSYSLYLTHVIVLGAVIHLGIDRLPIGTLVALVIAGSLLAAQVMFVLVERPCQAWGRALTR